MSDIVECVELIGFSRCSCCCTAYTVLCMVWRRMHVLSYIFASKYIAVIFYRGRVLPRWLHFIWYRWLFIELNCCMYLRSYFSTNYCLNVDAMLLLYPQWHLVYYSCAYSLSLSLWADLSWNLAELFAVCFSIFQSSVDVRSLSHQFRPSLTISLFPLTLATYLSMLLGTSKMSYWLNCVGCLSHQFRVPVVSVCTNVSEMEMSSVEQVAVSELNRKLSTLETGAELFGRFFSR